MPVTIPAITLVDIERKDLAGLKFYQVRECTGPDEDLTCVEVWHVQAYYHIRTDADDIYTSRTLRNEAWPLLKTLMLPAVDEVISKINQVEGM